MTTAAVIDVRLSLNAKQFQKGTGAAAASAANLERRIESLDARLRASGVFIGKMGDAFSEAGKRMTQFVSIPILGFFALIIKKAIDADTALGKMAQSSLGRLNESLAKLGEKFLPLFIKFVDWLTRMIDKFLAAPPATQKFITMLVAMLALTGPIMSFAGWLIGIVQTLGSMGITLTSIIPAVASFGAALWSALLPLLPVLALIAAAVALVYLVWKNWDTLKVTIEQLWFILKWGFIEAMKAITEGMTNGMNAIKAKVKPVADFLKKTWSNIKLAFSQAFMGIMGIASRVFNAIRNAIMVVVNAIAKVKAAFASIKLPPALTPGSPTPFEMGLRGINQQMGILSGQSMPQMQNGFANLAPSGVTGVGGGRRVNYVDNSRYEAGVTPDVLKLAMNQQTLKLAKAME